MSLILSDEQLLLKQSAEKFFEDNSPVSRMRKLRDEKDETGFSRDLWKKMADLGWLGIMFPDEYGGLEMGLREFAVVIIESGRTLAPEPLLSTLLLGANAVRLSSQDALKGDVLPAVASGERLIAFAFEETTRFNPYAIKTVAALQGDTYSITGNKRFVLDGHQADQFVVVARTSGASGDKDGLALFLVDANAEGIDVQRTTMMDGRNAANISFNDVKVSTDRLLGDAVLLDRVLEQATLGQVAEMVGIIDQTFELTLQYLKDREQFSVKIGTFQALRHRAAEMFAELEFAKTLLLDGLIAIDEGRDDIALSVSAAKAQANKSSRRISSEAIQMHGGMGMTDELDIGLYVKRLRTTEMAFGDKSYHLRRFAALQGY